MKKAVQPGKSLEMMLPELSIVTPMFNEAENCDAFFARLTPILEDVAETYEIVCVNDGSRDETFARLQHHRQMNPKIKLVSLSRNFGKEAALTAGIDLATGKAVIPIDADLQDPPELLRDMVQAWREGAQVVLARRIDRSTDSFFKRLTSAGFYNLSSSMMKPPLPKNVGDFRLMDRIVVDALKRLPERTRFMKGLFAWVGYRQVTLDYVRPRRHSGQTSFNFRKLWNFALDGLFSFSSVPLKVWSYFGLLVSLSAVIYMTVIIVRTLIFGIDTPGYASMMSVMLLFNGMVLVSLGAIGEYVSRIFIEVKNRPLYLINEMEGFEAPGALGPKTSLGQGARDRSGPVS